MYFCNQHPVRISTNNSNELFKKIISFYRISYSLVFAQIPGWESAGNVYLQFISVDTAVNTLLQNRDINTLGYGMNHFLLAVISVFRIRIH